MLRDPEPIPWAEPVPTVFPTIDGADIAAVFVGKRVAGDFYDSIRVSPERVLIGLLDVSGRRAENRSILNVAQEIFRKSGSEIFAKADINESEAMTELTHLINRGLIEIASGVRSCPAFIACYHEKFGTLCYANAGHTPALIRDHSGISELDSTGLASWTVFPCHRRRPHRRFGERFLASGRFPRSHRMRDPHQWIIGRVWPGTRVKSLLQSAPATDAKALCTSILNAAAEFEGDVPLCDDRTALALVRTA